MDFRSRVLAVIVEGMSCRSVVARFGVAPSTAIRLHGQSRDTGSFAPKLQEGDTCPAGCFHVDIAEVRTAAGKLCLHVAIDRTGKFTFVRLARKTGRTPAPDSLTALVEAIPCKTYTVLAGNGTEFTFPPRYADGPAARYMTLMNQIIKEAAVKRYHDDSHQQFECHLE